YAIMSDPISRRVFLGAVGAAGVSATSAAAPPQTAAAPEAEIGVIDCHMHLKHGDAARTEWSADAIIEIMDKAGIEKSVVFGMSTTTAHSIELAKTAVNKYPQRLIPFLYALPNYERPVLKEIEGAISDDGFRGIKIHAGECTLPEYIIDP